MNSYLYLAIDLGCLLVPFIASFYPKHSFFKDWKYFIPANLIVAILFLIWDFYFTEMGIWGFNPDYLTGIYIANLPIEEVLFFIAIPYCCTFTFFAFQFLIKKNPLIAYQKSITIFLIVFLSLIMVFSFPLWYTSFTFISLIIFLLLLLWNRKDLSLYYLSFIAIYPFFLISNGILTGSGLLSPIVWYDNTQNLGVRIGTIPLEDTFYGMLLIFLNILLYQYFKKKLSFTTSNSNQ